MGNKWMLYLNFTSEKYFCWHFLCRPSVCDVGHKWQLCQRSHGSRPIITEPPHDQEAGGSHRTACCRTMQVLPFFVDLLKANMSQKWTLMQPFLFAEKCFDPSLMKCVSWIWWILGMWLTWRWWRGRTWEWRSPNCTAGRSHSTASVCSWMQTQWWERNLKVMNKQGRTYN